jgi:hypothetical protein
MSTRYCRIYIERSPRTRSQKLPPKYYRLKLGIKYPSVKCVKFSNILLSLSAFYPFRSRNTSINHLIYIINQRNHNEEWNLEHVYRWMVMVNCVHFFLRPSLWCTSETSLSPCIRLFSPLDQMRCDVTYWSNGEDKFVHGERLASLVHIRQSMSHVFWSSSLVAVTSPFEVNKWVYQGSNPGPCILHAMSLSTELCSRGPKHVPKLEIYLPTKNSSF